MERLHGLAALRHEGKLAWSAGAGAWIARPDDVVSALTHEGFAECKREITRSRRGREPAGGVWEGLDTRTGAVASASWVQPSDGGQPLVVIEIDGEPLTGAR